MTQDKCIQRKERVAEIVRLQLDAQMVGCKFIDERPGEEARMAVMWQRGASYGTHVALLDEGPEWCGRDRSELIWGHYDMTRAQAWADLGAR